MVKLIVVYPQPADPAAFDAHYFGTHIPLAERIPGLRKFTASKLVLPDGSASPFYLLAELHFDDAAALGAGLGSPEGQAASADVANIPSGAPSIYVADIVTGA